MIATPPEYSDRGAADPAFWVACIFAQRPRRGRVSQSPAPYPGAGRPWCAPRDALLERRVTLYDVTRGRLRTDILIGLEIVLVFFCFPLAVLALWRTPGLSDGARTRLALLYVGIFVVWGFVFVTFSDAGP
jgi:hypothetical protein